MPRVAPALAQFNGGEISPLALGRSDLKGFQSCATTLENFLPALVGAAVRRSGSQYEGAVKDHARRTWLKGFRFDDGRGYVFEFGHQVIRFWTEHGILLSGGSPLELPTAFTEADLEDADGVFRLHFEQSSDVVWVFSGLFYPVRIERTTVSMFALATFGTATNEWNQPASDRRVFEDVNTDQSRTVYVSAVAAAGATVTLTSVGWQFQPDDSNYPFYIEDRNVNDIPAWEAAKAIGSTGLYRRVDSRTYISASTGTTGSKTPVHTAGDKVDGDPGVRWTFNDPGFGVVLLPSIGAPTNSVTATIVTPLPVNIIGSGEATYRWAKAAWRSSFPSTGALFRERLCVARGNELSVSVLGAFEDFRLRDEGGIQQPHSAMKLGLPAAALWVASQRNGLLVGTPVGVYRLWEQTTQDVFGPLNYRWELQSDDACSRVQPVLAGASTLHIEATFDRLADAAYSIEADGFDSVDQNKLSDHILVGGVCQIAFQRFPDPVVWAVRNDGQLCAFTFMKAENVFGWSRHIIAAPDGEDAVVESVAVCPDPTRRSDEVTVVVRRTINGATRRYVEYLNQRFRGEDGIEQAKFLDSALSLTTVAPITQITGLGHLEAEQVRVVMDGQVKGLFTVSGGTISGVPSPAAGGAQYLVGLDYTSRLVTVPLELGGDMGGTSQGRTSSVPQAWVRLFESIGGWVGQVGGDLVEIETRSVSAPMDEATPMFTGLHLETLEDTSKNEVQLQIEQRQPLPMTVLALYPRVLVKGR